ncbi:MAG: nucleoside deaminase [Burkholderiales bacterium]|nr:nucleoside deaminase [Burkholderiales bacterium]MDE2161406.1 nucleoside deaminase [Burkholderiales bacterium]MDE2502882.1 nucleoside deaminase [Burkholderiales bacterium]
MSQTPPESGAGRPTRDQIVRHLRRANEVGAQAARAGRHPFGAILVAPDHETVLLEQGNIDTVNHAESTLARRAAAAYDPAYLWGCTLYTSVEPCCMCAGTAYWAHVGRVVYGMSEQDLRAETGAHEQNPTLNVPARHVFEHGQKAVDLIGPVAEVAPEIAALQRAFWSALRAPACGRA